MIFFFEKIFFTLYSINWPNFIFWLSLPYEILGNMRSKQFLFSKTSSRCLEDTFSETIFPLSRRLPKSFSNFLARRIQDVLKTSWRRLPRRLQEVCARCLLQDLFKTSLQDVFKTCLQYVFFKTFSRRVCKMSSSRLLQDVFARRFQNVFKTSSRGVCKTSSSTCLQEDVLQLRLEDVLEDKNMLHWRRMQDIFKKSSVHLHQNICFLGVYCNCFLTKLRDVMKFKINDTFLI